jgi:hypothetical protein
LPLILEKCSPRFHVGYRIVDATDVLSLYVDIPAEAPIPNFRGKLH